MHNLIAPLLEVWMYAQVIGAVALILLAAWDQRGRTVDA